LDLLSLLSDGGNSFNPEILGVVPEQEYSQGTLVVVLYLLDVERNGLKIKHEKYIFELHAKVSQFLKRAKDLVSYVITLAQLSDNAHRTLSYRTRRFVRTLNRVTQRFNGNFETESVSLNDVGVLNSNDFLSPLPSSPNSEYNAMELGPRLMEAVTEFTKLIYQLVDSFINFGKVMVRFMLSQDFKLQFYLFVLPFNSLIHP
jgi:hypothetical protein